MKFEFDPVTVGTLERDWWKAHNEKNKPLMLEKLIQEHQELYSMGEKEANQALVYLAQAAKYHDVRDWDKAKEKAMRYYEAIKKATSLDFDSRQLAEMEVGWWKLHDKLEFEEDKSQLARAFTKLYAAEFGVNSGKLEVAGKLKAQATREHDLAEAVGVGEDEAAEHWNKAGEKLTKFYRELLRVVQ